MSKMQRDKGGLILGIDPGSEKCGWGLIRQAGQKVKAVAFGVIKPPAKDSFGERLRFVALAVSALLDEHKPANAAFEEQFIGRNPMTGLKIGVARGVCLGPCFERGLAVGGYFPVTVKQHVTGNGHATKEQVQAAIKAILGVKAPEDAADALAVALTHASRI